MLHRLHQHAKDVPFRLASERGKLTDFVALLVAVSCLRSGTMWQEVLHQQRPAKDEAAQTLLRVNVHGAAGRLLARLKAFVRRALHMRG